MKRDSTSPKRRTSHRQAEDEPTSSKQQPRNIVRQSGKQNTGNLHGTRITAETMTKKQEALLKNRLKNLVK